jgi:hypothetical protein
MTSGLKVIEVSPAGTKLGYDESNVRAVFPPKVPDDGTPEGDDVRFYTGTIDAMSTQIVQRLVSHEED